MKKCTKCGVECNDQSKFCENCGNPFEQQNTNEANQENTDYSYGNGYYYSNGNGDGGGVVYQTKQVGIQSRGIALSVILSIVTCGIYGIYWMIKINDEVNLLAGEENATTGGMVFLFSLITCGIYGLYWLYKMGERCERIKGTNGDSAILYLVLGIFGLSIVSYCLIQDNINKVVE